MPATVAADAHAIAANSYRWNCEELCSPVGSELGRNCGDGGRRWRERRPSFLSFLRSWRVCGWQKTHVVPNWLLFSQEWLCHTCEKDFEHYGSSQNLTLCKMRMWWKGPYRFEDLTEGVSGALSISSANPETRNLSPICDCLIHKGHLKAFPIPPSHRQLS